MTDDIVERLRSWRHDSWPADPLHEAAAEIERLRERVEALEKIRLAAARLIRRMPKGCWCIREQQPLMDALERLKKTVKP